MGLAGYGLRNWRGMVNPESVFLEASHSNGGKSDVLYLVWRRFGHFLSGDISGFPLKELWTDRAVLV